MNVHNLSILDPALRKRVPFLLSRSGVMPNKLDLTGQKFGKLLVVKMTDSRRHGSVLWECACDCGNQYQASTNELRSGNKASCGCIPHGNTVDLSGQAFGRLTAVEATTRRSRTSIIWECKCECGTTCFVAAGNLKYGTTLSCGCLSRERGRATIKNACAGQIRVDGTSVNQLKRKNINKNNKTGVRGVSYTTRNGKYVAQIVFKRKTYFLGYHDTVEEASAARKAAEEKIYGEFLEWYYSEHPEKRKEK